ncbi:MAG: helix-turn-helix domain-containing protein [Propionibacteriales bacterium]|nr:helix-turn-helix domain-containing protein [Propionibacteriales bacterium]
MDGQWLSTAQVAERYEIPEPTVRYWRHIGYGPTPAKLGRHIRYLAADWDAFLKSLLEAEQRKRQAV